MKLSLSIGWKFLAIAPVVLIAVLAGAWEGANYYTSRDSFCGGSCHIMNEQYVAWQKSKHYAPGGEPGKHAACIDCHFLPGEKRSFKAMMEGARHLAAYLYDRDAHLPIRPVVKDGACLRSGCHALETFQDKTIQYGEKSTFRHRAHFEKEMLKGQKLFCDTCHVKHSAERHFEAPKDICFTCHFRPGPPKEAAPNEDAHIAGLPEPIKAIFAEPARNGFRNGVAVRFNTGPNKCSLCHTIPTKSLQQQLSADDPSKEPITHQTLETAGVTCESCHLHEVTASDEIK
ncbi:MAG: NapC/NirT family cytochrome c, partial [Rhodospirillales bacterium]